MNYVTQYKDVLCSMRRNINFREQNTVIMLNMKLYCTIFKLIIKMALTSHCNKQYPRNHSQQKNTLVLCASFILIKSLKMQNTA